MPRTGERHCGLLGSMACSELVFHQLVIVRFDHRAPAGHDRTWIYPEPKSCRSRVPFHHCRAANGRKVIVHTGFLIDARSTAEKVCARLASKAASGQERSIHLRRSRRFTFDLSWAEGVRWKKVFGDSCRKYRPSLLDSCFRRSLCNMGHGSKAHRDSAPRRDWQHSFVARVYSRDRAL